MKEKLKQALLNYIGEFFVEYAEHETAFATRTIPREIFEAIWLYKKL